MSENTPRPLGGRIWTPGFRILVALAVAGILIVIYRLFNGLGSVTAMNDGYAWGIWKPFNVVTLTGIASGGFAVGVLTYVFNKGEYHPIARSAILIGAIGYSLAGLSVLVDLGRYWNLWVVFFPPFYNLNSVLLEVAICVVAYTIVLWIELSPVVLEHWSQAESGRLRTLAVKHLPRVKKALPWIAGLAVLLPTMHQSSLGGLYMISVTKLHALWHTPWLAGLFLISCLTMGFGAVFLAENLTGLYFHRRIDTTLLSRLAKVPVIFALAFVVIRLIDLGYRGRLGIAFALDFYSWLFAIEMLLFLIPGLMLLSKNVRCNRGGLFAVGLLFVLGGLMYRFDTYLVAFNPISGWRYFPSILEMLFSVSLVSGGIAMFIVMVKAFPILSGVLKKDIEKERTYA